jgi:putative transcriptional regulator
MKKKKRPSGLAAELNETAEGMQRIWLLDRAAYDKVTLRHLGTAPPRLRPSRPHKRCASARMSQAVFASYLNLTVEYVSPPERGTKRPTGAALALLNIIKRKGIEAIF